MSDLDFSFQDSPWELYLNTKRPGETVSAAHFLTLLEEETESAVEDAFAALEERGLSLDISGLPVREFSGQAALRLKQEGVACQTVETQDQVGGGSVPMQLLPGWAVQVETGALSVDGLEARMRRRALPVVGRIHKERYLLDVRTLREGEFDEIARAAAEALK